MQPNALKRIHRKLIAAPESIIQALYDVLRAANLEHAEIMVIIGENIARVRIDTIPASNDSQKAEPKQ